MPPAPATPATLPEPAHPSGGAAAQERVIEIDHPDHRPQESLAIYLSEARLVDLAQGLRLR